MRRLPVLLPLLALVSCVCFVDGAEILLLSQDESSLVNSTNGIRRDCGLQELAVSQPLMNAARTHAAWMAAHGSMTHSSGPYSENIAAGYGTPAAAMNGWYGSSGHRANLLSGSARVIGVGVAESPGGTRYWCWQSMSSDRAGPVPSTPGGGSGHSRGGRHRRR